MNMEIYIMMKREIRNLTHYPVPHCVYYQMSKIFISRAPFI